MRTAVLLAALALFTGCVDTSEAGYDEDPEVTDLRADLEAATAKLESSRSSLEDAQASLADLQSEIADLESEQANFGRTDWKDVVPAIGSKIGSVSDSADQLDTRLSDLESSLAE